MVGMQENGSKCSNLSVVSRLLYPRFLSFIRKRRECASYREISNCKFGIMTCMFVEFLTRNKADRK